jgi:D-glycero-alpha-D-manno-heptose-7-phosphate kinase
MANPVTVEASAPVRLDFAGGWTDVAPFATEASGVVVNAAIELRARATVVSGGDTWHLESGELGRTLELGCAADLERGDDLPLLRAAVRVSGIGPCRIRTGSAAPPGSGLGSSGALGVALVAAVETALGRAGSPAGWAEAAWRLEAVEAALPGGKQDQYAAALGGFHRLGFAAGKVSVERIPVDSGFADELARSLVVCYTGQSRVSSRTIERVMGAYARRDPLVTDALHRMADVADRAAEALRRADLGGLARLLAENWTLQQRLDEGMRTDGMARLERAMAGAGALGGKAAGAGAGGTMFFLVSGDREPAEAAARAAGATVLPVAWANEGVRVW